MLQDNLMAANKNFEELELKSFEIKFDMEGSGYRAVENIGSGAYGVVCSATNLRTGEKVAIKKIPNVFQHLTITKRTYREIRILKHFKHDNIIAIKDILKPRDGWESIRDVYIVLDLMESDLHRIIHSKQELTEEHVRYFLYQLLRGLKYIHSASVVHRDLKPSNLLVNENCDLKIGDLGMARGMSSLFEDGGNFMTQYVATRWYRAPELLLAPVNYSVAVDMWSVGCIYAEMLRRKQLFPGKTPIIQFQMIVQMLGMPSNDFIGNISSDLIRDILIGAVSDPGSLSLVKALPSTVSKKALDLLERMLIIDPQNRIPVEEALWHPFLSKYHDPDDEPICTPSFNFDFEKEIMTADQLKACIVKEIKEYHEPKPPTRLKLDLRPVPLSEIQRSPTRTPKLPEKDCTENPFLACSRSYFGNSLQNSKLPVQLKTEFCHEPGNSIPKDPLSSGEMGGIPKKEFLIPPPPALAQTKKRHVTVPSDILTSRASEASDAEMPSARKSGAESEKKSESGMGGERVEVDGKGRGFEALEGKSHATSASGGIDVDMPSARRVQQGEESGCNAAERAADDAMSSKAAVKAALLKAALRKQQNVDQKPRPITAIQRQREREEKRRKKLEKALERKKKKVPTATLR